MRLLDRYIFQQVLFACLGAVGFFTFVMLTGNVLRELLGFMVTGQLAFFEAVPLIAMLVPFVFVYTLPMGILCGVLLVLGRLSAESETVAMRAAGLSLGRIARPVYLLAAILVVLALGTNLYYMPLSLTREKQQLARILHGDPLKMIVPKTFLRDFHNCVVYVNEKHGEDLRDIWVWDLDNEQRVERFLRAESGKLQLDEANNQVIVTLNRGSIEERNAKDLEDFHEQPHSAFFEATSRALPLDVLTGQQGFRRKIDWYTWNELLAEVERLRNPETKLDARARERAVLKVQFEMQNRLSTAFTVLSFALIAVPLGIKVSRRETSANLGVALILAMSYYFLTIAVTWLDNKPSLHPELLIWLPNAIFVVVALWLHRRAERA